MKVRPEVRAITLAMVPKRASVHDNEVATCDTTTAAAPTSHHRSGQANSAIVVETYNNPADNQTMPIGLLICCVSCGMSAIPKAFAEPMK